MQIAFNLRCKTGNTPYFLKGSSRRPKAKCTHGVWVHIERLGVAQAQLCLHSVCSCSSKHMGTAHLCAHIVCHTLGHTLVSVVQNVMCTKIGIFLEKVRKTRVFREKGPFQRRIGQPHVTFLKCKEIGIFLEKRHFYARFSPFLAEIAQNREFHFVLRNCKFLPISLRIKGEMTCLSVEQWLPVWVVGHMDLRSLRVRRSLTRDTSRRIETQFQPALLRTDRRSAGTRFKGELRSNSPGTGLGIHTYVRSDRYTRACTRGCETRANNKCVGLWLQKKVVVKMQSNNRVTTRRCSGCKSEGGL